MMDICIVSDVLPGYFFYVLKGVVNMARFQLRHVREQILYKESIYLVSVLSSAPRCLFPAAIVVEL